MSKRTPLLILTAVILALGSACAQPYTGPPADLVIHNAKVMTIDRDNRQARAVAVIGEPQTIIGI